MRSTSLIVFSWILSFYFGSQSLTWHTIFAALETTTAALAEVFSFSDIELLTYLSQNLVKDSQLGLWVTFTQHSPVTILSPVTPEGSQCLVPEGRRPEEAITFVRKVFSTSQRWRYWGVTDWQHLQSVTLSWLPGSLPGWWRWSWRWWWRWWTMIKTIVIATLKREKSLHPQLQT